MRPSASESTTAAGPDPLTIAIVGDLSSVHLRRWATALQGRGHRVIPIDLSGRGRGPLKRLAAFVRLRSAIGAVLRQRGSVLAVHYAPDGLLATGLRGLHPVVVSVWGADVTTVRRGLIGALRSRQLGWFLRAADERTATSSFLESTVRERFGVGCEVVPFGVDPERFRPPVGPRREGPIRIGFVKWLEPKYGPDVLVEAAALLAADLEFELVLAGDGRSGPALRRRAAELGVADRVRFTGRLRHEEVPALLADLDIFAMPSRFEEWGVSAAEAACVGLPVVATRVGGVPEIVVDGETGILIPPENPAALAAAILRLARDPELRARMGAAGRERVVRLYAWDRCVDAMEAVLRRAVDRPLGGRETARRTHPAIGIRARSAGARSRAAGSDPRRGSLEERGRPFRVAHVNDIATVGRTLVAALRAVGVDARLVEPARPFARSRGVVRALTAPLRVLALLAVLPSLWVARDDIVHVHYAWKAIVGLLSGRPYVVHCHGSDVRTVRAGSVTGRFVGLLLRRAQAVYFATPDLAPIVRSLRPDARFLPNPIDTSLFAPATATATATATAPGPRDVLIGVRLDAIKGVDEILATVAALVAARPGTTFTVIDQGRAVGRIVTATHGGAEIIQPVAHEQLPALMRAHRVAIGQMQVGAIGNYELEAMAAGLPVAASFARADEYGVPPPLVDAPSAAERGRRLAQLLDDPDACRQLGLRASAWVAANHSAEAVAEAVSELYASILDTPRRGGR